MKKPILLAAVLSVVLSGCVMTPVVVDNSYPPGPVGPGPLPGYINTPGEARSLGVSLGRDDRRDGRSHYAGRYRSRVPSHLWSSFNAGYETGYHSTGGGGGGHWPGGGHGHDHDDDYGPGHGGHSPAVYQSGHRAGQLDRIRGLSPNYRRHMGEFPMRYESSFRSGYQAGWH